MSADKRVERAEAALEPLRMQLHDFRKTEADSAAELQRALKRAEQAEQKLRKQEKALKVAHAVLLDMSPCSMDGCPANEPEELEIALKVVEAALKTATADALILSGYGDDDERFGSTIEEYVGQCNESLDADSTDVIVAGEDFYVDCCFYRTEHWRMVSGRALDNPSAPIVCARILKPTEGEK